MTWLGHAIHITIHAP